MEVNKPILHDGTTQRHVRDEVYHATAAITAGHAVMLDVAYTAGGKGEGIKQWDGSSQPTLHKGCALETVAAPSGERLNWNPVRVRREGVVPNDAKLVSGSVADGNSLKLSATAGAYEAGTIGTDHLVGNCITDDTDNTGTIYLTGN